MKIFLSWSGNRSKLVAEFLSSWIEQVIQATDTWISTDIDKGARWNEKVSEKLEQTKVGIICLTRDNLNSNWILFEAGALSKTKDAIVGTFLLDIKPSDVEPPLSQFQHTLFDKEDIRKLLRTINNKLTENKVKTLKEKDLDEVFEVFYPKLEEKLIQVKEHEKIDIPTRTDRELIEEILTSVREIKSSATFGSTYYYPTINEDDLKVTLNLDDYFQTKKDSDIQKAKAVRVEKKIGRNDPCPCGSGKKYKDCHGKINT